jgi:endo-1,3-1,4-beta-glycanase ExoK
LRPLAEEETDMKVRLSFLRLAAVTLAMLLASTAGMPGAPKKPSDTGGRGWRDDFNGPALDTTRWVIVSGQAPGYIDGDHIGYYDPTHVQIVKEGGNSFLELLLTQVSGQVGSKLTGTISRGALIYTKDTYGYGTYEWRMRMSSTAATPSGSGDSVSGSVSAGFNYVNNSQTEIDFEFSGLYPETLYMVNWKNPNTNADPTEADETFSTLYPFSVSTEFHTYRFVWQRNKISYYVDDVLQAVHTTNLPSAPANFMINHWGTDSGNWGGSASVGTTRYFYVDWASFSPQ